MICSQGSKFVAVLLVALSFWRVERSHAQSIVTTSASSRADLAAQPMGRDFYFAAPESYQDQPGKSYSINICANANATVHLQFPGKAADTLQLKVFRIRQFLMPLSWEIKTSGIVENKAIHIWCDNADLSVSILASDPYGSEGTQILPASAFGMDYVVASYNSLYEAIPYFSADYPSEFTVTAIADNTVLTITPTQDIRDTSAIGVLHRRGVQFNEILQAGQAVQYKLTQATSGTSFDATGTTIHSTKPIGVIGATQDANIPWNSQYPNFICEAIPPIRTWGMRYYTAPFFGRKGGDTFLVIASADSQAIYTQDYNGKQLCATLKKNAHFWVNDVATARAWTSDRPFLLMQYSNSSQYSDASNTVGFPTMMSVPPQSAFQRMVLAQTPAAIGSENTYTNYAHVAVPHGSSSSFLFDGTRANGHKMPVDGLVDVYLFGPFLAGIHSFSADSGVGVMLYGYSSTDMYGWSSNVASSTPNSTDITPPVVTATGHCFTTHVEVRDTGTDRTGLNAISVDSSYNMQFVRDASYKDGVGIDSTFYDATVIDSSKEAYVQVSIFDVAGNKTTATSIYRPLFASLSPRINDLGVDTTATKFIAWDTIWNMGEVPFIIEQLGFEFGNRGFTLDSADKSPIPVGHFRVVKFGFTPLSKAYATDTLILVSQCITDKAIVVASGGSLGVIVTDYNFGWMLLDSLKRAKTVSVIAVGGAITVDSISVEKSDFAYDSISTGLTTPFVVQPDSKTAVRLTVTYRPTSSGPEKALICIHTHEIGDKCATLSGTGLQPEAVSNNEGDIPLVVVASPNPLDRAVTSTLVLHVKGAAGPGGSATLCDALGREVCAQVSSLSTTGSSEVILDIHALPAGTYFYRFELAHEVRSGRIVIE